MNTTVPPTVSELEQCRKELVRIITQSLAACEGSIEARTIAGALANVERIIMECRPASSGTHEAALKRKAA